MTLQELEVLKQERLANQGVWREAARANAKRAKICAERLHAAGFIVMRRTLWEKEPDVQASDVEEAGEIFIEHKKFSLAEAERLVAEFDLRRNSAD